jgi:hypothetical protein
VANEDLGRRTLPQGVDEPQHLLGIAMRQDEVGNPHARMMMHDPSAGG